MCKIEEDINKALDTLDFQDGQEIPIQRILNEYLLESGYHDIKKIYKQTDFRLHNLGTTKADLIFTNKTQDTTFIIEVKNQIDLKRGPSRFERAFVDVAYLTNEIKENNVRGFLLYIDKEKTRYLDNNHFTEAAEKVLPVTLVSNGWHDCNNEKWEYNLFEVNLKNRNNNKKQSEEEVNALIEKRINAIQEMIKQNSYLYSHIKKFEEETISTKDQNWKLSGAYLFANYSFLQLVLNINKLFSSKEYFSLNKFLNHILQNIKLVKWKYFEHPNDAEEIAQIPNNTFVFNAVSVSVILKSANKEDLRSKKEIIKKLRLRLSDCENDLEEIKIARDKIIAHLDKNYNDTKYTINIKATGDLLLVAQEIFNKVLYLLTGNKVFFENLLESPTSVLLPISKYYQIQDHLFKENTTKETSISIEDLIKIMDPTGSNGLFYPLRKRLKKSINDKN